MKVLIVEDEQRLGRFLRQGFAEHSYTATWVSTCADARRARDEAAYDAIVLDLSLPDGDGLDLLVEWRKAGIADPVLILSARDALGDRIQGLNLGADDYLPKPFSLEELVARVRALLRRHSAAKQTILEYKGLRLDLLNHAVSFRDVPIEMTNREYALLEIFMQNPGRVLTRAMISEKIWVSPSDLSTNLLDVYMSRLRTKLEAACEQRLFKTIRGVGYQLT